MRKIGDVRKQNTKPGRNIKTLAKQFYQSSKWRKFREEMRRIKRAEHEQIVMDVYESNPDNNPDDLWGFLHDDKQYPLSEMSLRDGIIKRANTLDHIVPIKAGGGKLDPDNVQWLTEKEHHIKTRREQEKWNRT